MSKFDPQLPNLPGIPPPYQPGTLAVGFSDSSVTTQTTAVNINTRVELIEVRGDIAVALIPTNLRGVAIIQLMGGSEVYIGFDQNFSIFKDAFRLVVDDPLRISPVVPVFALGAINSLDVPASRIQVMIIEDQ